MKQKDLSPQHTQFVNQYFAHGLNATQAYLATYPKSSYDSAKNNGNRLLTNDDIQISIQKKFAELQTQSNISVIDLINKLSNTIDRCERDDDRTNLLKAIDHLAKMLGVYAPKKIEQINHAPIQINIIAPENYVPPTSRVQIQTGFNPNSV